MTLFRNTLLILILLLPRVGATSPINITIDDKYGDPITGFQPIYSPDSTWNDGSTCTGCFANVDPFRARDGSWHDATTHEGDSPRSVTVQFHGTAVYVYFILSNNITYTAFTNVEFFLDGHYVDSYLHYPDSSLHNPDGTSYFCYDVPVYVNTLLTDQQHTMVIQGSAARGGSLILFDYLVYTVMSATQTTTAQTTAAQTTATTTTVSSPGGTGTGNILSAISIFWTGNPLSTVTRSGSTHDTGGTSTSSAPSTSSSLSTTTSSNPDVTGDASTSNARGAGSSSSTSSHSSVRAIVGYAIGGFAGLLIVVIFFCVAYRRRKDRIDQSRAIAPAPYNPFSDRINRLGAPADPERNDLVTSNRNVSTPDSSKVTRSSVYGYTVVGADESVTLTNPASTSKAAMHQEIAERACERELELANLQDSHPTFPHSDSSPDLPSYTSRPLPSIEQTNANLAGQIAILQRQVESLRSQQQQIFLDMNEVPPPQYVRD